MRRSVLERGTVRNVLPGRVRCRGCPTRPTRRGWLLRRLPRRGRGRPRRPRCFDTRLPSGGTNRSAGRPDGSRSNSTRTATEDDLSARHSTTSLRVRVACRAWQTSPTAIITMARSCRLPPSMSRLPAASSRASAPHAEVQPHDRRDVQLVERGIGLKGISGAPDRTRVGSPIGEDLASGMGAQRLGDPRRGAKRGDAVAAQDARDRGVVDARPLGEGALAQAPGAQLGGQPASEGIPRNGWGFLVHELGLALRVRGRQDHRARARNTRASHTRPQSTSDRQVRPRTGGHHPNGPSEQTKVLVRR